MRHHLEDILVILGTQIFSREMHESDGIKNSNDTKCFSKEPHSAFSDLHCTCIHIKHYEKIQYTLKLC